MNICDTCANKNCNGRHYSVIGCTGYRGSVQTNGQWLRDLSDEQLAKFLYYCDDFGYCKKLTECVELLDTEDGIPEEKCIGCILEWLKSPAKGENNEP